MTKINETIFDDFGKLELGNEHKNQHGNWQNKINIKVIGSDNNRKINVSKFKIKLKKPRK